MTVDNIIISNAQRILFNIYTSSKHPIFVKEMREIDAFFDELNPDIKVIWGLSDDDSLDEDAKVTILATGLNNELADEIPSKGDDKKEKEEDYLAIIEKLYHPIRDNIQVTHQSPQAEDTETEKTTDDLNNDADNPQETDVPQKDQPSETILEMNKRYSLADRIRNKIRKIAIDLEIVYPNKEEE